MSYNQLKRIFEENEVKFSLEMSIGNRNDFPLNIQQESSLGNILQKIPFKLKITSEGNLGEFPLEIQDNFLRKSKKNWPSGEICLRIFLPNLGESCIIRRILHENSGN